MGLHFPTAEKSPSFLVVLPTKHGLMKKTATGDFTENAFFPSKLSPLHLVYVGGVHRIHFPALFPQSTPRYIQLICATLERLHPPSLRPHTQQCQRRRSYAVEKRGGTSQKQIVFDTPLSTHHNPPSNSECGQGKHGFFLLSSLSLCSLSLPRSPTPYPSGHRARAPSKGFFPGRA